jgi:hypothetical protein
MQRSGIERWGWLAGWLVAAVALLNSGCAVVAVGACAAAGGAAGYAYYKGNVSRDYAARPEDVRLAARTAIGELDLKVTNEAGETTGAIEVQTASGDKATIMLDTQGINLPGDGTQTRVGVRVGPFGNADLSNRIHDQIAMHLVPVNRSAASSPPLRPMETAPPPLAGDPSWKPQPPAVPPPLPASPVPAKP